jgi:hypothetical protein
VVLAGHLHSDGQRLPRLGGHQGLGEAARRWRGGLSNTLGAEFCVEALAEALDRYGRPEIFNTDQSSQFTSDDFTRTLKRHG